MKSISENKHATNFLRPVKNSFTPNVKKMNFKPQECLLNHMESGEPQKQEERRKYDQSNHTTLEFCPGEQMQTQQMLSPQEEGLGWGCP